MRETGVGARRLAVKEGELAEDVDEEEEKEELVASMTVSLRVPCA